MCLILHKKNKPSQQLLLFLTCKLCEESEGSLLTASAITVNTIKVSIHLDLLIIFGSYLRSAPKVIQNSCTNYHRNNHTNNSTSPWPHRGSFMHVLSLRTLKVLFHKVSGQNFFNALFLAYRRQDQGQTLSSEF